MSVDLVDMTSPRKQINVPLHKSTKVGELVDRYHDIFSKDELDLGKYPNEQIALHTKEDTPIKSRPYRVPFLERERDILKKKIVNLLDAKIIRPSPSKYSQPCILVDKKDGSKKLCIARHS